MVLVKSGIQIPSWPDLAQCCTATTLKSQHLHKYFTLPCGVGGATRHLLRDGDAQQSGYAQRSGQKKMKKFEFQDNWRVTR